MEELLRKFADWSNKNSGLSQLLIWIFGVIATVLGYYGHVRAKSGYQNASSKSISEKLASSTEKIDGLEERMSAIERAFGFTEEAIVRLTTNQERIAVLESKLNSIENLIERSRKKGQEEKAEEMKIIMATLKDLTERLDEGPQRG